MIGRVSVDDDQAFAAGLISDEPQLLQDRNGSLCLDPLDRFRKTPRPPQLALHAPPENGVNHHHDP